MTRPIFFDPLLKGGNPNTANTGKAPSVGKLNTANEKPGYVYRLVDKELIGSCDEAAVIFFKDTGILNA